MSEEFEKKINLFKREEGINRSKWKKNRRKKEITDGNQRKTTNNNIQRQKSKRKRHWLNKKT